MLCITKWLRESALAYGLFGVPELPTAEKAIENWALSSSKICSADQLIAAGIIESMAKDLDKWVCNQRDPWLLNVTRVKNKFNYHDFECQFVLHNSEENIKVLITPKCKDDRETGKTMCNVTTISCSAKVNTLTIDDVCAHHIYAKYSDLLKKKKVAEEIAAAVKLEMELNEEKWKLAEKLLKMKRNEHGALVPIKTAEDKEHPKELAEQVEPFKNEYEDNISRKPANDVNTLIAKYSDEYNEYFLETPTGKQYVIHNSSST